MVAVRENHPDIVQLLIARGADVNAQDADRARRRSWVLPNSVPGFGHGIGIVRGGLPPRGSRQPIPGAMTPLLYAARDGRLEAARMLLDAGADIESAATPTPSRRSSCRDHQQPPRRRTLPDRARRGHQGRGLVRPHAALGRGRDPQHGHGQRHVREQHRSRAVARVDQGPARARRQAERADEGSPARSAARSFALPVRWRGWTSLARRRSSPRRSPATSP